MNLFAVLNRGVALAGGGESWMNARKVAEEVEATRERWLNALRSDQIRAWMNIGTEDRASLNGLCTVLTLVGMAHAFDCRTIDTLEIRIIRGAISAAEQCGQAGSVMTVEHARSFSAAAGHAVEIASKCSQRAIEHACLQMHELVR